MKRRVFISYEHPDQLGSEGFDADAYDALTFDGRDVERHSGEAALARVRDQLGRTAVTLVLIGPREAPNEWVEREIEWSLEAGNGLVGIKLDPAAAPPAPLFEAGAEILDWSRPEDVTYLEHAIESAVHSATLLRRAAQRGTGSGKSCARPTARAPKN